MASSSKPTGDVNLFEPKKIKTRAGTGDEGRAYEVYLLALFSLRCAISQTEEMWIKTNADRCGALDDFLIFRRENGTEYMYMIQSKHALNQKLILPNQLLQPPIIKNGEKKYEGISLLKYANAYKTILEAQNDISNMLNRAKNNLTCIFYTNNKIKFLHNNTNGDSCSIKQEDPNSKNKKEFCDFLQIEENHHTVNLFNTKQDSTVFNINFKKLSENCYFKDLDHEEQLMLNEEFSEKVLLFSNQAPYDKVKCYIVDQIKFMINCEHISDHAINAVADRYIYFITTWSRGDLIKDYFLTKQDIIVKLTELILIECNYVSSFYKNQCFNKCSNYLVYAQQWDSLIQCKSITIIDASTLRGSDHEIYNFLYSYLYAKLEQYNPNNLQNWEEAFSSDSQQQFYETASAKLKEEMVKIVGRNGNITQCKVYKALWKLKKIPKILEVKTEEEYKNLFHILQLSNYDLQVIIINKTKTLDSTRHRLPSTPTPFTCLEEADNCSQSAILQKEVNFQGKMVVLKDLVESGKIKMSSLTIRDIIKIIMGTFSIGGNLNQLPSYFIKRTML